MRVLCSIRKIRGIQVQWVHFNSGKQTLYRFSAPHFLYVINSISLLGSRVVCRFYSISFVVDRTIWNRSFCSDDRFKSVVEPYKKWLERSECGHFKHESSDFSEFGSLRRDDLSARRGFVEDSKIDAETVLEVLKRDGPGFDTLLALDELQLKVSWILVREVLMGIWRSINVLNKPQCAKLGYKFFVWSGKAANYQHTVSSYHMIMKILAECKEMKAMWRLLDEMCEKGYPATARTFTLLINTCGDAGLASKVVGRFINSKTFNYRPLKHSYNAILHALLVAKQYKLIEGVYQKMLDDGHSSDMLSYNALLFARCKLGKLDQFDRLLDEMARNGFSPDNHTYNILLYVLGKGDNRLAALNLMKHMKEVGNDPSVLHFTTLINGFSRAGNLDACKYFFDELANYGCTPDIVCYNVMITSYTVAGEHEKARELFDEMIIKGQLPSVFTYNSMIHGFCKAGKFEEAYSMLVEMESRGCRSNFRVYSTLVNYLRYAGKHSEADKVITHVVKKGQYAHLVAKLKGLGDARSVG